MRKNMLNTKWFWLLAFMPLVLFMAGCSDCTSCTVPRPTVTATIPICGAVNVALNSSITATFSEAMDPASINATTFTVTGPGTTAVAGSIAYASGVATFTPASSLAFNTTYTVNISTAAKSVLGVSSVGISGCTFKTIADPVPPTVVSTSPGCGVIGVPVGTTAITATFSKPMDPTTMIAANFAVTGPGTTPIAGAVTFTAATNTVRFTPAGALPLNTLVTITVTTGAKSLTGTAMAATFVCSFTTAAAAIPPTVTAMAPACGATGVPTNRKVAVTFSEVMDATTITGTTFTVTGPGVTAIPGTITYAAASNIATFTPTPAGTLLPANTLITVTVTTGVKDLAGIAMASNFSCTFTTALAPDTTAPTVISTNPSCGATLVALNTKVAATFSEAMDPLTITGTTFTLTGSGATLVPGAVVYAGSGSVATFTPTSILTPSAVYTITVTTGAKDLAGNALASNFTCTFTTGPGTDVTPPTVNLTSPVCGVAGVALNKTVNATFSEAMDASTITNANFLLTGPGTTTVPGLVSYDPLNKIATFTPTSLLASNTLFTFTITTGVRDMAGNPMAANFVCTFTTAATLGPAPVILGTANGFVILAGSTVTNTGPSVVTGDVGLSPGSAVTGFVQESGPGVIIGTLHIADAIAAQAKLDLTTAYNDAAGRSLNVITVATGELGGLTLAPGLYRSGISSFAITSVDLTLDAQGDANAIWIFQMPSSTLTVGNGRKVILAGGANPANIFWQVGSSATLGTTSVTEGTIMAAASITLQTGAVLHGRALAQIAAVSLDSNVVTKPGP